MKKNYSEILGIDLSKRTRKREYSTARYSVFYSLYQDCYRPCEISRQFGYDHSTVVHGIKTFKDLLDTKDDMAVYFWSLLKLAR
ncbi:MAG TPA: hypothetical protein DEP71_07390 [Porphyromonadaceae bacterium]|nr:hypothetical protein [Porphyromonadaceae bacterium]